MMQAGDKTTLCISQQWCWIGERDSGYLEQLTAGLADLRPLMGEDATIEVSLIGMESKTKLPRVLAKTRADIFVWSIPTDGIADRLGEIDACRRLHYCSHQIAAGLASPREKQLLMEAGCCWHVEQPHQWQACLAVLCGNGHLRRVDPISRQPASGLSVYSLW